MHIYLLIKNSVTINNHLSNLQPLLIEILKTVKLTRCYVIITDHIHHALYDEHFFKTFTGHLKPYFYVRVNETEDLLAPSYHTVRVLKQSRQYNCELYIVTLINGQQSKRFIEFINEYSVLNTKRNYVLLSDERLFVTDMYNIWCKMISVIFLQWQRKQQSFAITTIAFPHILNANGILIRQKLINNWRPGKHFKMHQLFADKSANLMGVTLPIAVAEHVPMVMRDKKDNKIYKGIEIEILNAIGKVLNFQTKFYNNNNNKQIAATFEFQKVNGMSMKSANNATENIDKQNDLPLIIGQLLQHRAKIAIGDLHLYKSYADIVDFAFPHNVECLTFLTPESTKNNSWKTLIQPFSGGMWAGVLLSLFAVGFIFYFISFLHALLLEVQTEHNEKLKASQFFSIFTRRVAARLKAPDPKLYDNIEFRVMLNNLKVQQKQQDIFDDFSNCIFLTYSMLLYVALPRMPRNWPLRVLTGWYWIYCILLTVTYRASFTAILANPAPRITIDTLEDLLLSHIRITTAEVESKRIFQESYDAITLKLSTRMDVIQQVNEVTTQIAKGQQAYYDNIYFLRHLRYDGTKKHPSDNNVLHIMRECAFQMPVALALERNSPLKPHIDKHLLHLIQGGFIVKWLRDAIRELPAEEQHPQEALMDLSKFWSSFVALVYGYIVSLIVVGFEYLHFKYVIKKHPLYDAYNTKLYYNFKRLYPDL